MSGAIAAVKHELQWETHISKLYQTSTTCTQLVTTTSGGGRDAVVLSVNEPITIGRNPKLCSYVLPENGVSDVHCKLYAHSSDGGIIVCCQDLSRNGVIMNGHNIRGASVILMNGDIIEIPASKTFKFIGTEEKRLGKSNVCDSLPSINVYPSQKGRYTVTSQCLGSGSFATVHLALDLYEHRQVACKMIKTRKEEMAKVWKEVQILRSLDHPNINKIYDVNVNGPNMQIFLQLCTGGNLFMYISSRTDGERRLEEREAKYIMYQILRGLLYLHDKNISHRDLKPENLLLFSPGRYPHILIADFGLACPKANHITFDVCGTVQYLPPEGILALDNKYLGYFSMPADCWSAGVILFIMLAGFHPFHYDPGSQSGYSSVHVSYDDHRQQLSKDDEFQTKKRIVNGSIEFNADAWSTIPNAKELVARLLIRSPCLRATVYQALQSAWINEDHSKLENA